MNGSFENELIENESSDEQISRVVNDITAEINNVIVGQQEMVRLLIAAILADGHVLIEGAPGLAKTLAARMVAKTIDAEFSRVQFTPDLMPSDVLGTSVFNPKYMEFEFKKGPVFSNIILIDEINRAPAKTQSALFEVMEERQVTMDGISHRMQEPFMVIATQNPLEYEGTYRLPEAQLDRFLFKINLPFPSLEEEVDILMRFNQQSIYQLIERIKKVVSIDVLKQVRKKVNQINVDEKLFHFIAQIVHASRNHHHLFLGGSPRASLALLNASKAIAAMEGRNFLIPDDVIFCARPVLNHRLMLTAEKEMEGVLTYQVIDQIIESTPIPR